MRDSPLVASTGHPCLLSRPPPPASPRPRSKMADPRYNEAFGDAFDLFTNSSGAGELTVR